MTLRIVLAVMIVLYPINLITQVKSGSSPKESLSPQTYRRIVEGPQASLELQIDQLEQTMRTRMNGFEMEHMRIAATQTVILEQLKMVLEIRKQVFIDSETIHSQEERIRQLESSQSSDPASIATLKAQMNWLLALASSLVIGSVGWMLKQMHDSRDILKALQESDALKTNRHTDISDKLDHVESKAEAAYQEANTVNQKIENIGMKMRDDGRL